MTLIGSEGAGQSQGTQGQAGNPSSVTTSGTGGTGGTPATTGNPSWRDSLPEDIRGHSAISQFKDIDSLAKSYIHAQSMIGKKGVVVPGEKATPEEWGQFYKEIGQPELDKYEVASPKDVPVNEDFVKKYKEVAHKNGFLPKQAQAMMDWYVGMEKEMAVSRKQAQDAAVKEGLEGLKKEWGQGYDTEVASARLAAKEAGLVEFLDKTGLGNDVSIIKGLAKLGKMYGEDRLRGENGGKMGQTPADIRAEIDRVMNDPSHPYYNAEHPGHRNALAQIQELYKKLHG